MNPEMTALAPDYVSAQVRLYCGDCLEIMPEMDPVDLCMTDPPYGLNRDGMKRSSGSHGGRKAYAFGGWDSEAIGEHAFELIFARSKEQCIFGANYFPQFLMPSMGWLVWEKGQDICGSDCELAFTSRTDSALRRLVLNRVELMKDGAVHPTQKPIKLMNWCMGFFPDAQTVLDPYMGSGTTGIACLRTNRKFIGIEKDPTHFATALERIRREEAQGRLL